MPPATRSFAPEFRHLLVPLDGSEGAARALPVARALAGRLGAEIHTVSVATAPEHAGELRDHAAKLLGTDPADERVHVVVGDDPARTIRAQAATLAPCLVCMATHGRARVPEAVIGSVARNVVAASAQPVVTVGPACPVPE